jgi:ethanolamine permease
VYAALAWYVAGLLYFAFVGRHRLVLSPEEEFAMAKGKPMASIIPAADSEPA